MVWCGFASILLFLSLYSTEVSGECDGFCTSYETFVCETEMNECNGLNGTDLETCLQSNIPCYLNSSIPISNSCWAQFVCCMDYDELGDNETLGMCLRFADECADLSGRARDRCTWRVSCDKNQPIPAEDCPTSNNLCFTMRQRNCSCINERFFNCEISCDLTTSCCLERTPPSGPEVCDQFDVLLNTTERALIEREMAEDFESEMSERHGRYHGYNSYWRKYWRKFFRKYWWRRTTTMPPTTTTTATTTTTTTTPEPTTTTRDPSCPPDPTYEFFVENLDYSTCECNTPPWLPLEFIQGVFLNFTFIMNLAPVGIQP